MGMLSAATWLWLRGRMGVPLPDLFLMLGATCTTEYGIQGCRLWRSLTSTIGETCLLRQQ